MDKIFIKFLEDKEALFMFKDEFINANGKHTSFEEYLSFMDPKNYIKSAFIWENTFLATKHYWIELDKKWNNIINKGGTTI